MTGRRRRGMFVAALLLLLGGSVTLLTTLMGMSTLGTVGALALVIGLWLVGTVISEEIRETRQEGRRLDG